MKRFFIRALVVLAALVTAVAVALPFAAPPLVESAVARRLAELGFPADTRLSLAYRWSRGPAIVGTLSLSLRGSPLAVQADFGASPGRWYARARLPETILDETDPTIVSLLRQHPLQSVTGLVFSAAVSLDASVERTPSMPVPVWSIKAPVTVRSAEMMSGRNRLAVEGLSVTPVVSGIADHVDIAPIRLRVRSAVAAGFTFTNLTAQIRADERRLVVNEAKTGLCGGTVSAYSIFLDTQSLNAGFTAYLDDVDAGQVLSHFQSFRGKATGRLHGKMRLFARAGGQAVRLSDAYLYSTPGETGKLQVESPEMLTEYLAYAGLDDSTRDNVTDALTDLDYSVLRLHLRRTAGDLATLGFRIGGTATRGRLTVPVNIDININGEIEQIINTTLGYSALMKGNTGK